MVDLQQSLLGLTSAIEYREKVAIAFAIDELGSCPSPGVIPGFFCSRPTQGTPAHC